MVFVEASDSFITPDGDLVVPAGELIPKLPELVIIPDAHPTYEWAPHCIQGTE